LARSRSAKKRPIQGGEMLFEKLLLHPLRDRELTAG
jgi:hypothetical protein